MDWNDPKNNTSSCKKKICFVETSSSKTGKVENRGNEPGT